MSQIINAFRGYNREEFRNAKLGSQMMALAPPDPDKPEGTAFETKRLIFSVIGNPNSGNPRFFPILEEARIYHTAINELTGQGAVIDVAPFYVETGNLGKVFAKLVESLPLISAPRAAIRRAGYSPLTSISRRCPKPWALLGAASTEHCRRCPGVQ
ncbi:MAG: hypothetical protein IPH16_06175 [Haliscomenobacter sp.]|nr:hypothetical protein [Haliscomenobacter sp.]